MAYESIDIRKQMTVLKNYASAYERCTTTLHDGKTKRSVRVHKQNERARKRAKRTQ